MADDTMTKILWAGVIAGITGMYGFFLKHIIKHPDRDEINKQIDDLWEKKQSSDRCDEIVKRIDGSYADLKDEISSFHTKLDTILKHVIK